MLCELLTTSLPIWLTFELSTPAAFASAETPRPEYISATLSDSFSPRLIYAWPAH